MQLAFGQGCQTQLQREPKLNTESKLRVIVQKLHVHSALVLICLASFLGCKFISVWC